MMHGQKNIKSLTHSTRTGVRCQTNWSALLRLRATDRFDGAVVTLRYPGEL